MEARLARSIAQTIHAGQLDRFGEPVIDHVERVARAVPHEARALAYLHDVLERSTQAEQALRNIGLSDADQAVLALLTRPSTESYESHVDRIVRASGRIGRTARLIKIADLDDHLLQAPQSRAPDYAWARRQISSS